MSNAPLTEQPRFKSRRFVVWALWHPREGFETANYVPCLYKSKKDTEGQWLGAIPVKAWLEIKVPL